MTVSRINWIIEESAKWDKQNGVSYRFARITSTATGKSIFISDGIAGNVRAILHATPEDGTKQIAGYGRNEVKSTENWEDARDWNLKKKFGRGFDGQNSTHAVYLHDVTPKMLRALKTATVPAYADAEVSPQGYKVRKGWK